MGLGRLALAVLMRVAVVFPGQGSQIVGSASWRRAFAAPHRDVRR
jgi:hypothetical protein